MSDENVACSKSCQTFHTILVPEGPNSLVYALNIPSLAILAVLI